VVQTFRARGGDNFYVDAMVRSSNTTPSGGHSHTLYLSMYAYDNAGSLIGSSPYNVMAGYKATWTQFSMVAPLPANTAYVNAALIIASDEESGGWWEVDQVMAYQPQKMTSNGQVNNLGQVSNGTAYSVARAASTADSSYFDYAKDAINAQNAAGDTLQCTVNSLLLSKSGAGTFRISFDANGKAVINMAPGGGMQMVMDFAATGNKPRLYIADGTNVTVIDALHANVNGVNKY
jgi:hypothetical protein